MLNILVLCTGNSARSILLEHILTQDSGGRVRAYSAGSQPAGKVHPGALNLLGAKGYDTTGARSKSWDEYGGADAPAMDAVITVCGAAAGETCPIWPGAPVQAHWGVADPAKAAEAAWDDAFAEAYDRLRSGAKQLLEKDILAMSPQDLRAVLTEIGREFDAA